MTSYEDQRRRDRQSVTPRGLPWTIEEEATASNLWVEGKSAAEIAAGLSGRSRCAVIGRLHRMGVTRDCRKPAARRAKAPAVVRTHIRPPKPGPQSKPALVIGSGFTIAAPADVERVKAERLKLGQEALRRAAKVTVESPNALPFMEARRGCKWPIGEGLSMLSCCNPVERGSYCAGHRAVALSPVQPRALKPKDAVGLARHDRIEAPERSRRPTASVLFDDIREAA